MKKILLVAIIAFFTLSSFRMPDDKGKANVEQQEGIYLFMYSKPNAEYEYLGTIKIKAVWTGQPAEMLNIALRKMKKEFPLANGIIFNADNMDKADVIRFK